MKKLLITGANGFIGSYFFNKYKNKYDIQTFSFRNNNLETLNCKLIDVVVHLSALVHQMDGATAEEYEKINVVQTLNLARKTKNMGVKHFVFISTVKVYGEETNGVYNEKSHCQPKDEYGKSKLKAEIELLKLVDRNFKVCIIRTPIVYGFGVKANIKSLVNLINTIPILPFASIQNRRSMVYIGNFCHLIDVVIDKNESEIFLANDDEPLSTSKLIELIAKNLNKKISLVNIPFFELLLKKIKPSFYKRLYGSLEVNNNITKEKLNFENPYSVEKGIELMIKGEKL